MSNLYTLLSAPHRFFAEQEQNPSWILPFILGTFCTYALVSVLVVRVGVPQLAHKALVTSDALSLTSESSSLSAEQQRREEHVVAIELLCSPALLLAAISVSAFILWVTYNVVFGATPNFYRFFSVVTFAHLALSLKAVLAAAALFFTGTTIGASFENPVGTNLGFYLETSVDPRLRSILTSLDLFTLWYIALLIIGCSVITKMPTRKATAVVGSWSLVFIVGRVAWAAMAGGTQ